MNICHYNDMLRDELDGASHYIQEAINCKQEHPTWAQEYAEMSATELSHAATIMEIFEENFKIENDDSLIAVTAHKAINDMYSEFSSKIKYMHDIYKSK